MRQTCRSLALSRSIVHHSGVCASQGNGLAEQAAQAFEGVSRVHKSSFEGRVKSNMPGGHPVVPWLTEHDADMLNRCTFGKDGRTPHQHLKRREFVGDMFEFGSVVVVRVPGKLPVWGGRMSICNEGNGLVDRSRAARETFQMLTMALLDRFKSIAHDRVGTSCTCA